jgi:hypothetical protein
MNTMQWRRTLMPALVAGILAACETGTEPMDGPAFDAEAALADHQALDSLFASDAMDGFRAMARGITFGSLGVEAEFTGQAAAEIQRLGASWEPGAFALRIAELAAGVDFDPARSPIISSFRRGKTFVYDPAVGRYVMDEDREGAPATGVRFILYQAGPDGKPDPDKEVGYADLIDEGDESPEEIALRLLVAEGENPVLEYRTTVDVLEDGGEITVKGFLQGENERLDFNIRVRGTAEEDGASVDIEFEMGIGERDFLITGSIHGAHAESGEGGEINLTVRHGADSFSVHLTGFEGAIDGTFFLNGNLFATVEGDLNAPTILGASGAELTWAEILVLRQIIDSSEDVFDFFEDLVDPVDELVILALIL